MPVFVAPSTLCLSGTVQPAPEIDFVQRGTHRLVNEYGAVVAALASKQVNLAQWVGQSATVCGLHEGIIEGVHSLQVTRVLAPGEPPPSGQTSSGATPMGLPLVSGIPLWLPLAWLLPYWMTNKRTEP